MRLSGSADIDAPRSELWARCRDLAQLEQAVPGCESLHPVGARTYAIELTTGLASTHGTYRGTVSVVEVEEPDRCRLHVEVAGEPGTVRAEVTVRFADEGSGTVVAYDADLRVTGLLGAVGRRVLAGSVTRVADELFAALGRPADVAARGEPSRAASTPAGKVPGGGGEPGEAGMDPVRAGEEPGGAGEALDGPSRECGRRGWVVPMTVATLAVLAVVMWRSRRGGGRA